MTDMQLSRLDTEAFIEYAGVIHNSIVFADHFPLPPDVVDAMGECRREAFRRGIDLHPYMQKAPPTTVKTSGPVLVRTLIRKSRPLNLGILHLTH